MGWKPKGTNVPTDYKKRRKTELDNYYSEVIKLKKEVKLLLERKKNIKVEIDEKFKVQELKLDTQRKENNTYNEKLRLRDRDLVKNETDFKERQKTFNIEKKETEAQLEQTNKAYHNKRETLARKDETLSNSITAYRNKLSGLIEKENNLSNEKIELAEQKRLVEKKTFFNQELESSIKRKQSDLEQSLNEIDKEKENLFKVIQKRKGLLGEVKKEQDKLDDDELKFQKEKEAFEEKKKSVDNDAKAVADLGEKLSEQEDYQKDVERKLSIERKDLDKKIKLYKQLRKGGK